MAKMDFAAKITKKTTANTLTTSILLNGDSFERKKWKKWRFSSKFEDFRQKTLTFDSEPMDIRPM